MGGQAIDIGRGSSFRQRGGLATIAVGDVKVVNMSYADFYNTSINGSVTVKKFAELRLLGGANIMMNGLTIVGELGLIQISDNVILHANVDCEDGGVNSVDSGTPNASSTGTINGGP